MIIKTAVFFLILLLASCQREESNRITLFSGPSIKFSNTKATKALTSWAKELNKNGGSVSQYEAVNREREVVQNINSGLWDVSVYHEYQRMASVTGNVDSARLLLTYGVKQTIDEVIYSEDGLLSKLFKLISTCNTVEFTKEVTSDTKADRGDFFIENLQADDGTNLLMVAAYFNCTDMVALLLQNDDIDINMQGTHGMNALLIAAARGHSKVIELLVSTSTTSNDGSQPIADINIRHKFNGNNALHMAAEMDHADTIQTLCNFGIEHQAVTNSGSSALHIAASSNASYATIHALVEDCGIPVNSLLNNDTTALYLASQVGYVQTVTALINVGADVSFSMPFTQNEGDKFVSVPGSMDSYGYNGGVINTQAGNGAEAIHAAAENGHADVVRVLVTQGKANINSLSISVTPLHLAAQYNQLEVAKELLELGAEIDSVTYTDQATPLYHAVGYNYLEMCELLLKHGANVHARQRSDGFPLLYASMRDTSSDGRMVKLLLRYGARINDRTKDTHLSPLLAAIQYNNTGAVKALLSYVFDETAERVDLFHRDSGGSTVLHYAVLSANNKIMTAVARALRSRTPLSSADVPESHKSKLLGLVNSHTVTDGATALDYAATRGFTDMVHQLLLLGADMHSKMLDPPVSVPTATVANSEAKSSSNSFGATPLYLAVSGNHLDTVYLLMQCGADVNIMLDSSSYVTPLLAAIDENMRDMVSLLLTGKHPASISVSGGDRNSGGGDIAAHSRKKKVKQLDIIIQEIRAQTSSDAKDTVVTVADPNLGIPVGRMQSPLLFAVSKGYSKIVKLLLLSGSYCNVLVATSRESVHNLDLQDTLVDIAKKRRDFDTLQVLLGFEECDPVVIKARQREADSEL